MMKKIKHAFKLKGGFGKHIKTHGCRYCMGTFGTFALIKVFLIGASLLGFNQSNFTYAAGGIILSSNNVYDICSIDYYNAHCEGQNIVAIESGTFSSWSLSGIQSLYLNSNQLESLPSGVFDNLTNLQILDLSHNHLTSLPLRIFHNFGSPQIDLRYNYFDLGYISDMYGGRANIQRSPQNTGTPLKDGLNAVLLNEDFGVTPIYSGTTLLMQIENNDRWYITDGYEQNPKDKYSRTLYVGVPTGFEVSNLLEEFTNESWTQDTELRYGGPWDSCYRDWTEGTGPYVDHINNKIEQFIESTMDCSNYPEELCSVDTERGKFDLEHSSEILGSDGATAVVWIIIDTRSKMEEKPAQVAGMMENAINSGINSEMILSQLCSDMFGEADINQCLIFEMMGDLELDTVNNSCGSEVYWTDDFDGRMMVAGSLPYSENTQRFTFWLEAPEFVENGNDFGIDDLSLRFATIDVDVEAGQGLSCVNQDRTIELIHGGVDVGYIELGGKCYGMGLDDKNNNDNPLPLFCANGEFFVARKDVFKVDNVYNNNSCKSAPIAENVTIGLDGAAGHTLKASYDFDYNVSENWNTTEIASSIDGEILHTDDGIYVIEDGGGMVVNDYDPMKGTKTSHIYYYDKDDYSDRITVDSVDDGYFSDAMVTLNGLLYVKVSYDPVGKESTLLKYFNGNVSKAIDPIDSTFRPKDVSYANNYLFTPNENGVFYVTSDYLKYYNFDSGSSKLIDTLVNGDFNGFMVDDRNVFIPTKNGLFYSKEIGGESFLTYYNGTSSVVIESITNGKITNARPTENAMFYQIKTSDGYYNSDYGSSNYGGRNFFLKYSDGNSSRLIDYYNDNYGNKLGFYFYPTQNGLFYGIDYDGDLATNGLYEYRRYLETPKYYDLNLNDYKDIESRDIEYKGISRNGILYSIDLGDKTYRLRYYDFNSKKKVTIESTSNGEFLETHLTENGVFYVLGEYDEDYYAKNFDGDDGDYSINKNKSYNTYYLKHYDFSSKEIKEIDSVICSKEEFNYTEADSKYDVGIEIFRGDGNRLFYIVSHDGVEYIKYYNLNSDSIIVFDSMIERKGYYDNGVYPKKEADPLLTEDGLFYVIGEEVEYDDYNVNGNTIYMIYHLKHFNGTTTNIIKSSKSSFHELFMLEDRLFSIGSNNRSDRSYGDDDGDTTYENYVFLDGSYRNASINMHIKDEAGDLEGESIYQWYRNGQEIPGANNLTYNVLPSDVGSQISFSVIPVAIDGMIGAKTMSNTVTISTNTNGSTGGGSSGGGGGGGGAGGGSSIENTVGNTADEEKHGSAESSIDKQVAEILASTSNKYTKELVESYLYAYSKGITTMPTIDQAQMFAPLNRVAMAKMMANYVLDLELQELDTSKDCSFPDVLRALDAQYDNGVTKACQLGLMGVGVENFNPYGIVTRAEFGTVLSRALYGNKYNSGKTYYEQHLKALKNAGIMTKTDNPLMEEFRGWVMLMMMRADEKK